MVTIQFIPYIEISRLDSAARLSKLIDVVKEGKIIILQGRLRPQEESELIAQTMASIDESFKGIELSVIDEAHDGQFFSQLKSKIIQLLIGDRGSTTIIGPATLLKEIKKDPNKIQLLLEDSKKRRS